jgi:hypothetical protein
MPKKRKRTNKGLFKDEQIILSDESENDMVDAD